MHLLDRIISKCDANIGSEHLRSSSHQSGYITPNRTETAIYHGSNIEYGQVNSSMFLIMIYMEYYNILHIFEPRDFKCCYFAWRSRYDYTLIEMHFPPRILL